MRRTAGEDSWTMGLDFVTSYFHSFAPEERLSSSISKEQLTLPSVSSDVNLCVCRVGRSFICVAEVQFARLSKELANVSRMHARSTYQTRVSPCPHMPGPHVRLGSHTVPSSASSFLWNCWPRHLSTKAVGPRVSHGRVVWRGLRRC